MKNRLIGNGCLVLFLLISLAFSWPPKLLYAVDEVVSEPRSVSHFHAISLASPGHLVITQGLTEALTVIAEAKQLPYIKSAVQDGVLTLAFDQTQWHVAPANTKPIQFMVRLKTLDALTLTAAGKIELPSLRATKLQIEMVGPGNIQITRLQIRELTCRLIGKGKLHIADLKATQAHCTLLEEGHIELAGQLTQQVVILTNQGNYQAGDLESQIANVEINGTGNATLWVRKRLMLDVFGTGAVAYYGNPTVFQCGLGKADLQALGNK